MRTSVSRFYLRSILKILLLMGVLLLLHSYIVEIYYGKLLFFHLELFYIFHTLCAIVVCGLLLIPLRGKAYIGYRFVTLTLLQMIACLAFLLPMLLSQPKVGEWDILSFMFVFFVALIWEIYFALSLLKE